MAVSGSRNFIQTRNDIIINAMRRVRALKPSETPSAMQINDIAYVLNTMVESWQADSIFLWTVSLMSLYLTPNISVYNLTNDIIDIDGDGFIKINDTDFKVKRITRQEYQDIAVKNTLGRPIQMQIDFNLNNPILNLYYTPDKIYVLYYNKVVRLQDFTKDTDNPDFPIMWSDALILNLAYRIAASYNFPLDETQLLKIDALYAKDKALKTMKGLGMGNTSMRLKIARRRYY